VKLHVTSYDYVYRYAVEISTGTLLVSLNNKIVLVVRDIIAIQCADRAQHVLAAGSTNHTGRWVC
jgi:hypothetical protein